MENLRFYKLTGWTGHLLVQVNDSSLPDFHNFIVLKTAGGNGRDYQVLYRYDSQSAKTVYTAETPAEKICAQDADCSYWDGLKRTGEARETENAGAWGNFYFGGIRTGLVKKAGDKFESDKFSALGRDEVRGATARLRQSWEPRGRRRRQGWYSGDS